MSSLVEEETDDSFVLVHFVDLVWFNGTFFSLIEIEQLKVAKSVTHHQDLGIVDVHHFGAGVLGLGLVSFKLLRLGCYEVVMLVLR